MPMAFALKRLKNGTCDEHWDDELKWARGPQRQWMALRVTQEVSRPSEACVYNFMK